MFYRVHTDMESNTAKTALSPYAAGNGYESWKRLLRVRVAKLQRTPAAAAAAPARLLVHPLAGPRGGGPHAAARIINGAWTLGVVERRPAAAAVDPPPLPDITALTLAPRGGGGHAKKAAAAGPCGGNTRGLVVLSDTIHARTRKRIQRYSSARRQRGQTLTGQRTVLTADLDTPAPAPTLVVLPAARAPARPFSQREAATFRRITDWIRDCELATGGGTGWDTLPHMDGDTQPDTDSS